MIFALQRQQAVEILQAIYPREPCVALLPPGTELPLLRWTARLESSWADDEECDMSHLALLWYTDRSVSDIGSSLANALASVDWKELARQTTID